MQFRFHTFSELETILHAEKIPAPEYGIKREAFMSGMSEAQILAEIDRRIAVTRKALIKGLENPQHSRSGLTKGAAVAFASSSRHLIRDDLFTRSLAYALAINEVNACGGKVVSFPTAGSCGIVLGVIWVWWDTRENQAREGAIGTVCPRDSPDEKYDSRLRDAFLVASLTGVIIAQGATLAGSEGGCQAECGAAGAMAACALAYLEEQSLKACFSAAALSLKNFLGLVCDPVAGLVEVPWVKRNAFVAANALTVVDLTLSSIESIIPFDEMVWAMKQIGDNLPGSIKENSTGGLAITPTGLAFKQALER
ncbi:MAG: L-serine ammonia-lyase, iron-sulfur-dependent, subunit alpha [Treponema sp.]|jgi:L-serine dehydratase|nr:L-serine ammonia-lyase, iron-sulfur-dependent, subunit alpha [Treponema sp.]